jgi:hypothetical protein
MKTVAFRPLPKPSSPDEWVRSANLREETPEAPVEPKQEPKPGLDKRFSMLMPTELHSRVKMECARRGLIIADVIREFLEREFPAPR